jgi:hypothetical protein
MLALSQGCHNWVRVRESTGNGMRRFRLIRLFLRVIAKQGIQRMADRGEAVAGLNL